MSDFQSEWLKFLETSPEVTDKTLKRGEVLPADVTEYKETYPPAPIPDSPGGDGQQVFDDNATQLVATLEAPAAKVPVRDPDAASEAAKAYITTALTQGSPQRAPTLTRLVSAAVTLGFSRLCILRSAWDMGVRETVDAQHRRSCSLPAEGAEQ